MLVFTLTACQNETKEEVKELTEEYEVIVEVGFVPFMFENAEVTKYETIGNTTSRLTAAYEGVEYIFTQTKDREKDLTEGLSEDLTPSGMLYIDGTPAMIGYNEGADAFVIWGNDMYTYTIECKENFNYDSFAKLVSGTKDETVIEDAGLTAKFTAEGFENPTGFVNIINTAGGEALIESCPIYIMTNPGDKAVLTLTADAGENTASASVDGLIFAGEFDEEANAFIIGEQAGEIVGSASLEDGSYVYEVANPYADAGEKVAFAVGADIIAGDSFYTGEMAVVILEP